MLSKARDFRQNGGLGKKTCSVKTCNLPAVTRGYCDKHYHHIKTHGRILKKTVYSPNEFIKYGNICFIKISNKNLTLRATAIIDTKDMRKVRKHKWCIGAGDYVISRVKGKLVKLHRLVCGTPPDKITDHKNLRRLDNRGCNLRPCNSEENGSNCGLRKNNISGLKGVHWNDKKQRWIAQLTINKKRVCLGHFKNKTDAAKMFDTAATKHKGEFAYLNFPKPNTEWLCKTPILGKHP
jgi:hypothetical protein